MFAWNKFLTCLKMTNAVILRHVNGCWKKMYNARNKPKLGTFRNFEEDYDTEMYMYVKSSLSKAKW